MKADKCTCGMFPAVKVDFPGFIVVCYCGQSTSTSGSRKETIESWNEFMRDLKRKNQAMQDIPEKEKGSDDGCTQ